MISVLIPTKNEERDLPGCLQSVAWSDDVHVFDSHSTDATVRVAQATGARVWQSPRQDEAGIFCGDEAGHKNWALRNLSFRYPWVLHLDADERVTPELACSLQAAAAQAGDKVAFRVQRRDFLLGRWLKHVQTSAFYLRLFRPEKMRYERLINPVSHPDGPVGDLSGFLDHYPFSKGMTHWLARHNSYSTLEAQQIMADRAVQHSFSVVRALTARDFHERRFHQKQLFYRMPARPLLKFLLLYVSRLGFLDGKAGFTYAALQSFYEYMIVLKTRELAQVTPADAALPKTLPAADTSTPDRHVTVR